VLGGQPVVVNVYGNVLAEDKLVSAVSTGIAVKSRSQVARSINMVGKS
jgi:hypothetical protein